MDRAGVLRLVWRSTLMLALLTVSYYLLPTEDLTGPGPLGRRGEVESELLLVGILHELPVISEGAVVVPCQLFQHQTLLRENDNWQSASNANEIVATNLPPNDPKESAVLIRLEPGDYTTVVTGADGGTGIALVEVFEMDRD